jgi:hypothetical protein
MGGVEWFNSHVSPINIRYSTTSQQRLWPTNGKVFPYLHWLHTIRKNDYKNYIYKNDYKPSPFKVLFLTLFHTSKSKWSQNLSLNIYLIIKVHSINLNFSPPPQSFIIILFEWKW